MSEMKTEVEQYDVNGKRLLVRPAEPETKVGSVYLPENAKEKPSRGVVVKVGNGLITSEVGWQKDMEVVYSKYGGVVVELDGDEYVIITDHDVLLVR